MSSLVLHIDELLNHILSFNRYDPATLQACCTVSKHWHEVAIPILYHTFRLTCTADVQIAVDVAYHSTFWPPPQRQPISVSCNFFDRNPLIAHSIRHLILGVVPTSLPANFRLSAQFYMYRDSIQRVLSLLPRLRELVLVDLLIWGAPFPSSIEAPITRLEKLSVRFPRQNWHIQWRHLLNILALFPMPSSILTIYEFGRGLTTTFEAQAVRTAHQWTPSIYTGHLRVELLGMLSFGHFFSALGTLPCISTTPKLTVTYLSSASVVSCEEFLHSMADGLKELNLHVFRMHPTSDPTSTCAYIKCL